ncbi:GNAT family N-acetyltransferase [Streptomyces sp. NPDC014894]|uniref:GNAT family N-acetyltransferase n=1 Tax=unclassified Streptomyces TaxID=2593676 RepID=UPI0036FAA94B
MRADDESRRGDITVRRGIPAGAGRRAAELYWEAFGRKLGPALNPPEKAVAFLAAHLDPDRAVCALLDGELVGLAGYQHADRSATRATAADVLRAYGWASAPRRLALLALLEHADAPGRLWLDSVAVAAGARSLGIGSLLLKEVVTVALELGCQEVRLDVIDVNPRARALYERRGFIAVRTRRTPYLRTLMGFGAVTTMRRSLTASARHTRP